MNVITSSYLFLSHCVLYWRFACTVKRSPIAGFHLVLDLLATGIVETGNCIILLLWKLRLELSCFYSWKSSEARHISSFSTSSVHNHGSSWRINLQRVSTLLLHSLNILCALTVLPNILPSLQSYKTAGCRCDFWCMPLTQFREK